MNNIINIDVTASVNDFEGKDIMYLEMPGELSHMSLDRMAQLERTMNEREFFSNSNRRYRILPMGMKIAHTDGKQEKVTPDKVLLQCSYCKRYGAIYCACPSCGAPIGVPISL